MFCQKSCSNKFRNIYKKTPALESVLIKLIKKRLGHRRFPVNTAEFQRAPILKNICERLLLNGGNSLS